LLVRPSRLCAEASRWVMRALFVEYDGSPQRSLSNGHQTRAGSQESLTAVSAVSSRSAGQHHCFDSAVRHGRSLVMRTQGVAAEMRVRPGGVGDTGARGTARQLLLSLSVLGIGGSDGAGAPWRHPTHCVAQPSCRALLSGWASGASEATGH
jgi:hypothetical protein